MIPFKEYKSMLFDAIPFFITFWRYFQGSIEEMGVMCKRKIILTPLTPPTPMDSISSPFEIQLQRTPMD
jgi:hypothetical protein